MVNETIMPKLNIKNILGKNQKCPHTPSRETNKLLIRHSQVILLGTASFM